MTNLSGRGVVTCASRTSLDVVSIAYLHQAQALLPPGRAWTRAPGRTLTRLLEAVSYEFSRVGRRTRQLLEECDPRAARELLPDWERVVGLPSTCEAPTTLEGRRAAVHARLLGGGGQSKAFYVSLAAALGYEVTINDRFAPFTCVSACADSLYQGVWAFVWEVTAASGERDALLMCLFRSHAPGHTHVLFTFV